MKQILNAMRAQAQLVAAQTANTKCGIVSSYDPINYCAKVLIQPEGTETGWLPVLSPWVGNEWGLFAPVSPGDHVEVQFQEGSFENGLICGRFYNDNVRPLPAPCGEFWLVHKSGSALKFHNNGDVELIAHTSITSSAPVWNHTGDFNVTGNQTSTGSITNNGHLVDSNHEHLNSGGTGLGGKPQ